MAKKDNERPHVLPTDINRPFRAVDRSPKLNLNLSEFFSSNSLQRQSLLFTFYSLLKVCLRVPQFSLYIALNPVPGTVYNTRLVPCTHTPHVVSNLRTTNLFQT